MPRELQRQTVCRPANATTGIEYQRRRRGTAPGCHAGVEGAPIIIGDRFLKNAAGMTRDQALQVRVDAGLRGTDGAGIGVHVACIMSAPRQLLVGADAAISVWA